MRGVGTRRIKDSAVTSAELKYSLLRETIFIKRHFEFYDLDIAEQYQMRGVGFEPTKALSTQDCLQSYLKSFHRMTDVLSLAHLTTLESPHVFEKKSQFKSFTL